MRTLALLAICGMIAVLGGCKGHSRQGDGPAPNLAPADNLKVSELRTADKWSERRLMRGFYPGPEGWRWTARTFAVALDPPPPFDAPTQLTLDLTIPRELIGAAGPVTLIARTNKRELGRKRYAEPVRDFVRFPVDGLTASPALFEFELDGSFDSPDGEKGLILIAAALVHAGNPPLSRDDAIEAARRGYLQLLRRRETALSAEKQQELMKLFHEIPIWRGMWFHNVPIAKNPLDLWMMQQIIYECRPDLVVETGTLNGGSALFWAHTLNGAGLERSRVITVDIQDATATAAQHPLWKKYITFFKGSSTDPKIVREIASMAAGRRTIVTLDSDHTGDHVLNELRLYSPMVSTGSYLVVEDTHMDGVPTQPGFGRGPYWAVTEFLKERGAAFTPDLAREAFILTFNPGGWLRRN